MLGDLATQFERELFHDESMSVNLKNTGNLNVSNFKVEAMLNRASDKLMNLIERTNQMMIRNIKALRDLKMGNLSIKDDQIKRAQQQLEEMGETRNNRGRRSVRAPSGGVRPIRNTQAHRGQTNAVGNQRKWDTFVKERLGRYGSGFGLPQQVVVAFAAS